MSVQEQILGFVNLRREVSRTAPVRMKPLHKRTMSAVDLLFARSGREPKNLVGFLLRHWSLNRSALALPPARIRMYVVTPSGRPAVKIRLQQGC